MIFWHPRFEACGVWGKIFDGLFGFLGFFEVAILAVSLVSRLYDWLYTMWTTHGEDAKSEAKTSLATVAQLVEQCFRKA